MSKFFSWIQVVKKLRSGNKKLRKQVEELKADKFRLQVEVMHLAAKNSELEKKLEDCT